jgi:hemerythrin-like domain-containing protein
MPITIGSKPESDFSDPIGLLKDCHRRIEHFLGLLATIASQARDGTLSGEQNEALRAALRYFKNAAPKHTLDEEESLFPRLLVSQDSRARSAAGSLQKLTTDHALATELHEQVELLADRWVWDAKLSPSDGDLLVVTLGKLTEFYKTHIAFEEREVFTLAASVLTAFEVQSIGREMAARRNVNIRGLVGLYFE